MGVYLETQGLSVPTISGVDSICEKTTGQTLTLLQTDNGGEFTSMDF